MIKHLKYLTLNLAWKPQTKIFVSFFQSMFRSVVSGSSRAPAALPPAAHTQNPVVENEKNFGMGFSFSF